MTKKTLKKVILCLVSSVALWGLAPAWGSIKQPTNNTNIPLSESKQYKKPEKTSSNTLPHIIQEALKDHPSIEADKQVLSATNDIIDQATAGYMPSVDLRASLGRENIRRNFTLNSLNPLGSSGSTSLTRSDPSISLRQTLFDGMGTSSRIARAKSQRSQAHGILGVTIDTAIIDAASVIIDVRRLEELLKIANENIRFHQTMNVKIAEIVNAGIASISDLHQAEARLQDTFVAKANIETDLEIARAKFIEIIGKEPPPHIKPIRFPKYLTSLSLEMAIKMALDNNSTIKVAKSNVQIAESNHRESASKLVPTVTFELEGERDRNMNATTGFQNRLTAMVVARHNLFNGGADVAKTRETAKKLSETQARLNLARRQTERTIRMSWGEIKNSRTKSSYLAKLIQEKALILDTYIQEFPTGKRTLTDVLDAANDVFITKATRITADSSADINTVILAVGTGQFKNFIDNPEESEFDQEAFDEPGDLDVIAHQMSKDTSLLLAPYKSLANQKTLKNEKVNSLPFKRKSPFEKRKEQRQNGIEIDSTT